MKAIQQRGNGDTVVGKENTATLDELRELIEPGHLTPVIDSECPLDRGAEALARGRDGHPAGKVVVTIA